MQTAGGTDVTVSDEARRKSESFLSGAVIDSSVVNADSLYKTSTGEFTAPGSVCMVTRNYPENAVLGDSGTTSANADDGLSSSQVDRILQDCGLGPGQHDEGFINDLFTQHDSQIGTSVQAILPTTNQEKTQLMDVAGDGDGTAECDYLMVPTMESLRYQGVQNPILGAKEDVAYYSREGSDAADILSRMTTRVNDQRNLFASINHLDSGSAMFKCDRTTGLPFLADTVAFIEAQTSVQVNGNVEQLQCVQSLVRWVVWTLAAHERRQPKLYLGSLLTADNVRRAVLFRFLTYQRDLPRLTQIFSGEERALLARSNAVKYFCQDITPPAKGTSKISTTKRRVATRLSPLQRCTEIQQVVWPLCLVFSVSDNRVSDSSSAKSMFVTDGWYWTPVEVDVELLNLVCDGKLRDGCKIVVFGGLFQAQGTHACVLRLSYNAVRKAAINAPIGFVRPQQLLRGISLHPTSVIAQGGPIFVANVAAIKVFNVSTRLKSPIQCVMSAQEDKLYFNEIESRKSRLADVVTEHPEMSVTYIMKDIIGCDDWVVEAYTTLVDNGHVHDLSESQQEEMRNVHRQVEQVIPRQQEAVMRDVVKDLEVDFVCHQDVLVQCLNSGCMAVVRFPGCNQRDDGYAIPVQPGQTALLYNLKPTSSSTCLTPLYYYGSSSQCNPRGPVMPRPLSREQNNQKNLWMNVIPCLREALQHQDVILHRECSIDIKVIRIFEVDDKGDNISRFGGDADTGIDLSATKTATCGQIKDFVVVGMDPARVLVALRYSVPTICLSSSNKSKRRSTNSSCGNNPPTEIFDWLLQPEWLSIQNGLVSQVDQTMDILQMTRFDRTSFSARKTPTLRRNPSLVSHDSSSMSSLSDPDVEKGGCDSFDNIERHNTHSRHKQYPQANSDNSGMAFPSRVSTVALDIHENDVLDERRRYDALMNNHQHFIQSECNAVRETCARKTLAAVQVRLLDRSNAEDQSLLSALEAEMNAHHMSQLLKRYCWIRVLDSDEHSAVLLCRERVQCMMECSDLHDFIGDAGTIGYGVVLHCSMVLTQWKKENGQLWTHKVVDLTITSAETVES